MPSPGNDELLREKPTHVRYIILAVLFLCTAFSYGDRAIVFSITGVMLKKQLHLDPLAIGVLFSGFSWAYVAGQLPAGALLDRYGTKAVCGWGILIWSACATLVGCVAGLPAASVFTVIMALRLISGLAQAPVFPGDGRLVTLWFPTRERGRASATFNSAQYFSVVLFSPIIAWIAHRWGWQMCFWFMGVLGVFLCLLWFRTIGNVRTHPWINAAEIHLIEAGGALTRAPAAVRITFRAIAQLLSHRMLIGIYLGQFCIVSLTWFFLTWFPIYLYQARGMTILQVGFYSVLPALCGFLGGISGGAVSDALLNAGNSLTFARKTPIVIGMMLSMLVMVCNVVSSQTLVITLMSIAFFGKGFGALGWVLVSDTSPAGRIGLNGGVFNLIGNTAGITTPIIIGYLVKRQHGSFQGALIFVSVMAMLAILALVPLTGTLRRVELVEET